MRKSILSIITATFFSIAFLSSCSTSSEKVEDAQDNLSEANSDLNKANDEYLAEVAAYKKEAAEKIAANEKSIAEFKARKAAEKQEAQEEYNKKINELEQKNSDMKKMIDEYQVESKEKWEAFKSDFSHGMDELGKAFTGLAMND